MMLSKLSIDSDALSETTTLTYMHTNNHATLSLPTDASQKAADAVLEQEVQGATKSLAFFSRHLQPAHKHGTVRFSKKSRLSTTTLFDTFAIGWKIVNLPYLLIISR